MTLPLLVPNPSRWVFLTYRFPVRYYRLYANAHIIRHVESTFASEKPPPSHVLEQVVLMAAEESGDSE